MPNHRILNILFTLFFLFTLSLSPIFPMLVEIREITQMGERLDREWRFVSIPEYNASRDYAEASWVDSTRVTYKVLFFVNHAALILISWLLSSAIAWWVKKTRTGNTS
ncbi:MAG: hypothetical protein HYZ24_04765 [Chloroflexi bacterium]|nr:hypothetical protein [Chloroflexota bacterium]